MSAMRLVSLLTLEGGPTGPTAVCQSRVANLLCTTVEVGQPPGWHLGMGGCVCSM